MNRQTKPTRQPHAGRPCRRLRAVLLAIAAIGIGLSVGRSAFAQSEDADAPNSSIADTRQVIDKWVETRRLISKEKQDWELSRQMLEDRIDLVRREIENLREKIAEAEAGITEADQRRQELVEENERRKQTGDMLREIVTRLEQRTKGLLPRLPDPIRETVRPLSQRLPENPEDTEAALSQRFQNVIGVLNEVNKFNRDITVTSEVRQREDGRAAEVTAVYVGIGHGYYVGANNQIAGIGAAHDGQWVWVSRDEIAPQVAAAVAILNNEQVADFVPLPVAGNNALGRAAPDDGEPAQTDDSAEPGSESESDAEPPTESGASGGADMTNPAETANEQSRPNAAATGEGSDDE